jgi:hypothetical protein
LIRNVFIFSLELFSKLGEGPVFMTDAYVARDRAYFVDADGNVHYFEYLGQNLAFGDDDDR